MCIVSSEWSQARLSGVVSDIDAELAGQTVAQGGKAQGSTTGTGVLVTLGSGAGQKDQTRKRPDSGRREWKRENFLGEAIRDEVKSWSDGRSRKEGRSRFHVTPK